MSASGPTTTTVNIPPQLGSYAEVLEADWRHKKISIIGVVASFVRQLRPGQDLTRYLNLNFIHSFLFIRFQSSFLFIFVPIKK